MAAYTDRLLQHLLRKVQAAETAKNDVVGPSNPAAVEATNGVASYPSTLPTAAGNAQQSAPYVTASLSAPTWSTDAFGNNGLSGWGTPTTSTALSMNGYGGGGLGAFGGAVENYGGTSRTQIPMLWHGIGGTTSSAATGSATAGGAEGAGGGEQQDSAAFLSSFMPPAYVQFYFFSSTSSRCTDRFDLLDSQPILRRRTALPSGRRRAVAVALSALWGGDVA
jgi:hypothetical protein